MTTVRTQSGNAVTDVTGNMRKRAEDEDCLSSLESSIREFKMILSEAIDEYWASDLYTLKFYQLNHIVTYTYIKNLERYCFLQQSTRLF